MLIHQLKGHKTVLWKVFSFIINVIGGNDLTGVKIGFKLVVKMEPKTYCD